jgi:hypothetical protein
MSLREKRGEREERAVELDGPIGLFGECELIKLSTRRLARADDAKIYAFRLEMSLINVFVCILVNF